MLYYINMIARNIFDNFGINNGLKDFFIPNHNVTVDAQPNIIRVKINQETNTPGIKTPVINVEAGKRYRVSVTGYTDNLTNAFVTIANNNDFKNIAPPVYLKTINREIYIEFTPTHDNIQVFIVVYQPKIGQVFYVSDIKLEEIHSAKELKKFDIANDMNYIEPSVQPSEYEKEIIRYQPKKNNGSLNNLLQKFHKYNYEVEKQKRKERMEEEYSDSEESDDGPICLMSAGYHNPNLMSFSTGSFAVQPRYHGHYVGAHHHKVVKIEKPEKKDIHKENLKLGEKVVEKQLILIEKLICFIKDLKILIEESIVFNNQSLIDGTKDCDSIEQLKTKYVSLIKEMNYITLAKVNEIFIFTPYYNHFESSPLLIECNKNHLNDGDFNIYIKKYKLDTKTLVLDEIYDLVFSNSERWLENHQKSLMNLVAAETTLCNFKHKINQDIKKIKNRMLIFI